VTPLLSLYSLFNNEVTLKDIEKDILTLKQELTKISKPIEKLSDIYNVAMVATNGDSRLSNLVKDCYKLAGEIK